MLTTHTRRLSRLLLHVVAAVAWLSALLSVSWASAAPGGPAATNVPADQTLNLNGAAVRMGSVTVGNLDDNPATLEMVVGGMDGKVHAVKINPDGSLSEMWAFPTSAEINSAPAIADVNQDGSNDVIVTVGTNFDPTQAGGMYVIDGGGRQLFHMVTEDRNGGANGVPDGVISSPAIGNIDDDATTPEIVFGAWDNNLYCYHFVSGAFQACAWSPRFMHDTISSSPALADIDRNGKLEIVIGVDTHNEPAFGTIDGGRVYVIRGDGTDQPGWPQNTDETVMSSPAVGDIDGDAFPEIIVGSGGYWRLQPGHDPNAGQWVKAYEHTGHLLWTFPTQGVVLSSPALGDLDGSGGLDITFGDEAGFIYALRGDGMPLWPAYKPTDRTGNSLWGLSVAPIVADFDGDGQLDILQPLNFDTLVVRGDTGAQTFRAMANSTVTGSPAVGDVDGDGKLELVIGASNQPGTVGQVLLFKLDGGAGSAPWAMFHRDRMHSGALITPELFVGGSIGPLSVTFLMRSDGNMASGGASLPLTGGADWQAAQAAPAPWLSVTPQSGGTPATLRLAVIPGPLATGDYTTTVTLTGGLQPVDIQVTLRVAADIFQSNVPTALRMALE